MTMGHVARAVHRELSSGSIAKLYVWVGPHRNGGTNKLLKEITGILTSPSIVPPATLPQLSSCVYM